MTLITNLGMPFVGTNLPPKAVRDPIIRDGTIAFDFTNGYTNPLADGEVPVATEFRNLGHDDTIKAVVTAQTGIRIQSGPKGLLWPSTVQNSGQVDYLKITGDSGFDYATGNWALLAWCTFPTGRPVTNYDKIFGRHSTTNANANASAFFGSTGANGMRPSATLLPDGESVGTSASTNFFVDVAYDVPFLMGVGYLNADAGIAQVRDDVVNTTLGVEGLETAGALDDDPSWFTSFMFPRSGYIHRIVIDDLSASGRTLEDLVADEYAWRSGVYA